MQNKIRIRKLYVLHRDETTSNEIAINVTVKLQIKREVQIVGGWTLPKVTITFRCGMSIQGRQKSKWDSEG